MKQNVNYLMHHKNSNLKLIELNLNSTHISLYNALFLIWNECGFDTELSINRNDVMKLSKIGSANTYTKCLKELHDCNMICYKPSFNPLIGSKINLYRFDNGTDNGSDKGTGKSSSKGTGNGTDTLYKLLNKETIKLLNINYKLINEKLKVWIEDENITASPFSFYNSLIKYGFDKNLVSDWIKVRKTKKATNTETAFKNFIAEIEKRNFDLNEILNFIIVKNWSGFSWSWYDAEMEKEKSSVKKEKETQPIVAGRQTMETIQQNLDTTGLYVPSLQNK
jgi:hypothetical protein